MLHVLAAYHLAILIGVVYLIDILICVSPIAYDLEHLLDYFHIRISSLVRCLLRSLACFLIRLFDFFVVESSLQSLSHVRLFVTPGTAACILPFLLLLLFFLAMLHSKQDLSSLTRD